MARLTQRPATLQAIQEFNDFARLWVPPAIRDHIWDPRNNPVTSMVRTIKTIAPPDEPPVGYGVYSRVYEPDNKSRIEYVRVTLIFESPQQAENAYGSLMKKARPGDDFVICELRESK